MKKVLQYSTYYFVNYTVVLIAYFLHEISHFIFAFIGWYLSMNSFPIIHVTVWYHVKESKEEPEEWMQYSHRMHVSYNTPDYFDATILTGIVASAPIFLTILLFYFSPVYMYLLYIPLLPTLWISQGDQKQIKELFNKINMKTQNCINAKKELFFYPKFKQNKYTGSRTGSRRVVAGIVDDKNQLHIGVAQCSINDVFTKKAGRKIALQRAASPKVKHIVVPIENPNRLTEQFVKIAAKAQALPKSQL